MSLIKTICVCAGGRGPKWATEEAYEVGRLLALNGVWTLYGGGKKGSMGGVANGVLDNHGRVLGYMPSILSDKEIAHAGVDIQWVESLAERKRRMVEKSDAFLILPGAIGTMDELFDVWCQVKLGYQTKPIAILDTRSFFWGLEAQLKQIVHWGFAPQDRVDYLEWIGSLEALDDWIRKVRDGRQTERNGRDPEVDANAGR